MFSFLVGLIVAVAVVVTVVVVASHSEVNGDPPEGSEDTTAEEGLQLSDDSFYHSEPNLFVDLPDQNQDHSEELLVKFLGANSLYISDNKTMLLIDPFFTRPKLGNWGRFHGNNQIPSSEHAVERVLKAAGLYEKKVHAILVTHTHYDHAMDIAWVWKMTSKPPIIMGSESMRNILMWHENDSDEFNQMTSRFEEADINDPSGDPASWHKFIPAQSKFKVSFIQSHHLELPIIGVPFSGSTEVDVSLPAHTQDYKCGSVMSLFIEHLEHGSIFNQGSAGYKQDWLTNKLNANYLIPGVGGRDKDIFTGSPTGYARSLIKLKPSRILFSHWDNIDISLWNSPGWLTNCRITRQAFINELEDQGYSKEEIDARFLRIFGDVYLA